MRAPDEIMLGLECCLSALPPNCKHCPYRATPSTQVGKCRELLGEDAQGFAKQLESENAELMERLEEYEQ
jgi:hypothetical protein